MKKNLLRTILCVALATALVFALAVPAYADDRIVFTKVFDSSKTCNVGDTISLSAEAVYNTGVTGDSDIKYLWTSAANNTQIAEGTSIMAQINGNDVITCTAYGTVGGQEISSSISCTITATNTLPSPSPTVPVSVGLSKPTITQQPVGAKLLPGQTATLSVGVTCPNLGNGVSLVYQWFYSTKSNGANAVQISNSNASSFTTPVVNSTYYYFVGVVATNGTQTSEAVYSNIVAVTYNDGQLKITKNPTGETVNAGGSALFVARADNASSFVWRLVSKDTTQTINAKDAAGYFRGLNVSGTDTDTLALSNIPASMDGWSVECKFIGSDGKTFVCTTGAVIRVNGAGASNGSGSSSGTTTSPKPSGYVPGASPSPSPSASAAPNTGDKSVDAPSISNQPVGAVLSEGETTTLSVTAAPAAADSNVTIKYQWYRNDTNSNANGTAIGGAQSESYKPDTISGTKYYYVGVWSTDGTHTSKVVYSSPVAVTYTAPATTASPVPTDNANDKDEDEGVSSISILWPVIAMVLAAAAIGVGVFFLLRKGGSKKSSRDYSEYDDDSYNGDNYRR